MFYNQTCLWKWKKIKNLVNWIFRFINCIYLQNSDSSTLFPSERQKRKIGQSILSGEKVKGVWAASDMCD